MWEEEGDTQTKPFPLPPDQPFPFYIFFFFLRYIFVIPLFFFPPLLSIFFPTEPAPWLSAGWQRQDQGPSTRGRTPSPAPTQPLSITTLPKRLSGTRTPALPPVHRLENPSARSSISPESGPRLQRGIIQPRRGPASPGEAPTSPHPSQRRLSCSPQHGANPTPITRPMENPTVLTRHLPSCNPLMASPPPVDLLLPQRCPSLPNPQPLSCAAAIGSPRCEPERGCASPRCSSKTLGPPRSIPGCRARREERWGRAGIGAHRVQHPKTQPGKAPARRRCPGHPPPWRKTSSRPRATAPRHPEGPRSAAFTASHPQGRRSHAISPLPEAAGPKRGRTGPSSTPASSRRHRAAAGGSTSVTCGFSIKGDPVAEKGKEAAQPPHRHHPSLQARHRQPPFLLLLLALSPFPRFYRKAQKFAGSCCRYGRKLWVWQRRGFPTSSTAPTRSGKPFLA